MSLLNGSSTEELLTNLHKIVDRLPFIVTIIPVLNALLAGNKVWLRPSSAGFDFAQEFWIGSGLKEKLSLEIAIEHISVDGLEAFLLKSHITALYFFGGFRIAQELSRLCGRHYIEFYPEIEAADCKVFYKSSSAIESDVMLTLQDSFSHAGQSCQRIQGVYVHQSVYEPYLKTLRKCFQAFCDQSADKYIRHDFRMRRQELFAKALQEIEKAEPTEVVEGTNGAPLLVVGANPLSEFIAHAYFLPILWIIPFSSQAELIKRLNGCKFFLGLNIQSDSSAFVEALVDQTNFTRYTINTEHTKIRPYEGWGGRWPTGYSGYKTWLEHFSNCYCVIGDK